MKVFLLLSVWMCVVCWVWGGEVYPAPKPGEILTPAEAKSPSINGARVIGVRPNAELFFRVPVSGERPIKIIASGLPDGISLDKNTGILSGYISKAGQYDLVLKAKNKYGKDIKPLSIRVGEQICLTPPMGWNSWYSYGDSVTADAVLKNAKAMNDSGLANYGWSYINIDDCWQGCRPGFKKALLPNEKFPNMSELCCKVHEMGLKMGIYSTPWVGTYEGFRGSSVMNDGDALQFALPEEKRKTKHQLFGGYPGVLRQKANRVGDIWLLDVDARQWALWGFDYVKIDWNPLDVENAKRIAEDIRKCGRDMVLSLSNNASIKEGKVLSGYANCVRTTGDISDTWASILSIIKNQEKWLYLTRPGYWNDPDMLQVGQQGAPNMGNRGMRKTRLTPDEQYTQVSVWSLLSSPLLISADMGTLDEFTRGLLTNEEVIAVNQDADGLPASFYWQDNGASLVVTKKLGDGSCAVGVVNIGNEKRVIELDFEKIGLPPNLHIRDLWRKRDIGVKHRQFKLECNAHGCSLIKCKVVAN